MSKDQLQKAARLPLPTSADDTPTRILLMLLADRADDSGCLEGGDAVSDQLATEVDAVLLRLRGDQFARPGVDNARVTRVVDAFREARDE